VVYLLVAIGIILWQSIRYSTQEEETEDPVETGHRIMYVVLFGFGVLVCAVASTGLFHDFTKVIR
jgi:hypothetical protein